MLGLASRQAQFVSLQRDLRQGENLLLAKHDEILHFGEQIHVFADTAALIELMDLVVSADTAVAHLAGAMGKEVWILLPFNPDWRWMLERNDTPWYPTARLFRQSVPGDWDSVIQQIADELTRRLRDGNLGSGSR
jgi:hypothetical protein